MADQAQSGFEVIHGGWKFGHELGEERVIARLAAEDSSSVHVRGCALDAQ